MNNPHTHPEPDDLPATPEKEAAKPEPPAFSFSDVQNEGKHALNHEGVYRQERHHEHPSHNLDQLPHVLLRKGEENLEKEAESTVKARQLSQLVAQAIKDGKEKDKFSQEEEKELYGALSSLEEQESPDAIGLHAVHLALVLRHLRYIEEAKQALELALGIDPDNLVAKELFKELEKMHPPDISVAGALPALEPLSKSNLRARIAAMTGGKIIVVGDLLLDELWEGKPERISREAPVLILEHVDTELILGGAANTAHNIVSLGGNCHAVGVAGLDEYAGKLGQALAKFGVTYDLVPDAGRPTTVKTRVLSKSHSFMQQLLRLDRGSREPLDVIVQNLLLAKLRQIAKGYRAILLSDYRYGVICEPVIKACRQVAQELDLMVIVDAQDHFERFQNVTLITPNQPDAEKACGFAITNQDELNEAGEHLMLLTGTEALLITRGPHGMALFQQGQEPFAMDVFNRSEVYDVTGAGDTVIGTMGLALVTGSNFVEAMALGNLAASIVVKKPGTAVTSQREMLEALEAVDLPE